MNNNNNNNTQFSKTYYEFQEMFNKLRGPSKKRLYELITASSKKSEQDSEKKTFAERALEALAQMKKENPTPDVEKVYGDIYIKNKEINDNELRKKRTLNALANEQAKKTEEVLKKENHYISPKKVAEIKRKKEEDELMKKIESISDIDNLIKKVELEQKERAEINKKIVA